MFKAHQAKDTKLQQRVKSAKTKAVSLFSSKEVEGVELIHYNNKICVPETLVTRVMEHYHEHLCHSSQQRMERSISAIYTWPKMRDHIIEHVRTCHECQMCKRSDKKMYGLAPEKVCERIK